MAQFTLLEVHLDDAQFSANAPFSRGDADEEEREGSAGGSESDDSGGRPAALFVALGVGLLSALGLAAWARKRLARETLEEEAFEQPTVSE